MTLQSLHQSYQQSTIHYLVFGSGSKLLLCFHGYARDSRSFLFLEKILGQYFTIIAVDAPFHGKTKWNEGAVEDVKFVLPVLQAVKEANCLNDDKIMIMGFSMGGRMALSLLTIIPEKIDRMVLIATDGLVFNFWRWLVSETIFANGLIRHAIKNPSWALGLIKRVEKLGLIKKTLSTFLAHQFSDETKRKVLYQQVVSNKKIKPNTRVISQLIKQYSISVRMMYGENDQIVPAKNAIYFQKIIGKLVKVKRVKWGHSLLNESQVQNIQDLFGD